MDEITIAIRKCKRQNDKSLNLSGKNQTMINQEVFKISILEELYFSKNKLTLIDNNINQLKNLKVIDLSSNKLKIIPEHIFLNLPKLEYLNLSNNPLNPEYSDLLSESNQRAPKLQQILKNIQNNINVSKNQNDNIELILPESLDFGINKQFAKTSQNFGVKVQPYKQSNQLFQKEESKGNSKNSDDFLDDFLLKEEKGGDNKSSQNIFGKQSDKPSWLSDLNPGGSSSQHNINIGGGGGHSDEKNTLKNQLKQEKQKVKMLEEKINILQYQIEKAENSNQVQDKNYLHIHPYLKQILEVNYKELNIQETISQGGFSIVYHGYYRGTEVAIKQIFNPVLTEELMQDISTEINVTAKLNHPSIIKIMGIVTKPPNMCIVLEYMKNGSLFNYLHKSKNKLTEQQKLRIIKDIAQVLYFLHKSKIVHRDIKSHNILLDENLKIKLCDFGLSQPFDQINKGSSQFSGTPTYMALELYKKKAYDEKIDQFAFGTMMWEIWQRQVPWDGFEPTDISTKLAKNEQLPIISNTQLNDLIKQCRNNNPKLRPSFEELYETLDNML